MTIKEGKNFLRNCLLKCRPNASIDNLICYKYANRQSASDYQSDNIPTYLTQKDYGVLDSGVPYVVKCFIHTGIYVAWPQSIGRVNGKYVVYKRELVEMENDSACHYKDILIGSADDAHVYIFRGEEGILRFFDNVLAGKV